VVMQEGKGICWTTQLVSWTKTAWELIWKTCLVRPCRVVINRPFLYVMVHAPTGAIMHVAKVTQPHFLGVDNSAPVLAASSTA
jgi:hypothetical protein